MAKGPDTKRPSGGGEPDRPLTRPGGGEPDRPLTRPSSFPEKPAPAPKSRPPTSRLGRLARLGALAPHALPIAIEGAKRALGGKRSEADLRKVREKMLADARKA